MGLNDLDDLDRGLLHLLGDDARNVTTDALAERLDVASSTVANRIRNLEDDGIITGYAPCIDYEAAGFDRQLLVIGTGPTDGGSSMLEDIADVRGVVAARKLVTDEENVSITLLAESQEDVERTLDELRGMDIEIVRTEVVEQEVRHPFGGFGAEVVTDNSQHD